MKAARRTAEDLAEDLVNAVDEGLVWCKVDADIFRSLGVGRELQSHVKGCLLEWWAPKDLVELNRTLAAGGVSRKLRRRTIQFVLEGKKLPKKADDALALYAEHLFDQPNKRTA